MRPRRRHPLVRAFLAGETFLSPLLDRFAAPDGFLAALRGLRDALFGHGAVIDALERLNAIPLESLDPELLCVGLPPWMQACVLSGRDREAAALLRHARALLKEGSPPELRAQVWSQESLLCGADLARIEDALRRALRCLPRSSPHHALVLGRLAEYLAFAGRLDEVEPALREIDVGRREALAYPFARIRFFHAVETGRLEAARAILDAELARPEPAPIRPAPLDAYRAFLDALQGRPAAPGNPVAESTRLLLARRPEEALRVRGLEEYLGENGFEGFALLRAELALRHAEAAARLLARRAADRNLSYLDGFFRARLALLTARGPEAPAEFAETLRACERHGALPRLELELRLAVELDAADAFRLARGPAGRRVEAPATPDPLAFSPGGVARLMGESAPVREVRRQIRRLAEVDTPVLVTGETGTGKELAARALHEESSRAHHPFLAVNCAAIGDSLLESELFGHDRGAFTGADRAHPGLFEQAGEGTLFLDEIGEVSPRLQGALLRVLEDGEFRRVGGTQTRRAHCRILAATNAPLERRVADGRFRLDLLHRLQRLPLHLPSLQERPDDVVPLLVHFLAEGRRDGAVPGIAPELRDHLRGRPWPGNVRELRNFAERLRLLNSEALEYGLEAAGVAAASVPPVATPPRAPTPAAPGTSDAGFPYARNRMRRLDHLRGMFHTHGKLTRGEILRVLGVSPNTATADLRALVAEGFLERVEPSASPMTHYFRLRPAGRD